MRWVDWSYPRVLLVALVAVVLLALLATAGTSSASLGAFNPSWDGTSEVRSVADTTDTEPVIARNVSAYQNASPNRTIAFVMSPTEPYSDTESQAVASFVRAGGTVLVAEDYGSHGNDLLRAVGADARVTGVSLRDEQRQGSSPAFPRATPQSNHPYTANVSGIMLNHGSTIDAANATPLFVSSEFSYLDRNRNEELDDSEVLQRHPVVTVESVGAGTVIVVSDASVFLNAMHERSDNAAFARALLAPHDAVLLDVSHTEPLPPLVRAQLLLQRSGLASFLVGTVSILVLFTLTTPHAIGERVRAWRRTDYSEPTLTAEDIATAIQARHPEWDDSRVERVTNSLIDARGKGKTDE